MMNIGVLAKEDKRWKREASIISWYVRKGIALSKVELDKLKKF